MIDYTDSGFKYEYIMAGLKCYATVNAEIYDDEGLAPTGKYYVYLLHYHHGSCNFTMNRNDKGNWVSFDSPRFVEDTLIIKIGKLINEKFKF